MHYRLAKLPDLVVGTITDAICHAFIRVDLVQRNAERCALPLKLASICREDNLVRPIYTSFTVRLVLGLILLVTILACASPTAPELPAGAIRVNGTVQYYNLEGGFWAVRGDDGVTYDPIAGLAPAFQRENLRVTLVARIRTDMAGIHKVGPIVEILSIQPL